MNDNIYLANIQRFLGLLFLQILILPFLEWGSINIYIYPLFILLLPIEIHGSFLILVGFVMGGLLDIADDMDMLHAAATTLTAFIRPTVLLLLTPRGNYEPHQVISHHTLGKTWFSKYVAICLFVHICFISILEQLSISWVLFLDISLSFLLSFLVIMIYQFIFNFKA